MRLPFPFKNPLLGTSFRWLLWSDALTLLSMMVGQVALPWWIAHLPRPERAGAPPQPRGKWADEFRVGLRVNWAIPIERGWVICNFIGAVFMVPAVAMLVPLKMQSLGPAIAGVALTHWSVRMVYMMFGLLSAASALGFFLIPGFREFMALEHADVDGYYARTYPQAFEAG